jgi:hypothetical protein
MPSESEIIIAFIFKRSGKTMLSFSEFYLSLSMDLNWFSPKQAKEFVNIALKQKLLTEKDDIIKPNFDINNIIVPVGFYPSKKAMEEKRVKKIIKETNVLDELIDKIVKKSKLNKKDIEKKIYTIEKEKNINPEIAALLIGKDYNIPLEEFYKKIEEKIF